MSQPAPTTYVGMNKMDSSVLPFATPLAKVVRKMKSVHCCLHLMGNYRKWQKQEKTAVGKIVVASSCLTAVV